MNVALLIDCENANPESIDGILGELAEKGAINIRRAYGNWKNQFAYTKGKNAVDMCMAIDAMELLFSESVDIFALVTSDSDFTPLVLKLLAKGKQVIGFGESKTPDPFKKACSLFIHTDGFGRPADESRGSAGGGERRSRNELRGDTELSNLLRSAVEAMKGEDGWAPMTDVGQYITNNSSLSHKNYGYARWSDLLRATEYFDETVGDNHQPSFRNKENGNGSRS